ncbi:hypothetical protein Tco_1264705 [Tanacetum coccineum]
MEENKSINRSDIQKNLYNALVESYNSNKDIISSYGDVVTLKRGQDDQDKDEDPSAGSNRGSKRRRSGKEAESSKEPTHKESKSTSSSKGASGLETDIYEKDKNKATNDKTKHENGKSVKKSQSQSLKSKSQQGQNQKADEPVQSSSVSSDFTCKLLNLENPSPADNEIASLMETSARHATAIPEITFGFTTTTHPPTLFLNPLLQQQTPTFATTTSTNPTFKQTNQFAEAVSSIPGIVDTYLASKMKEAVDVAVQLQTNKLREEAQAENQEFLNQVDSTMKKIIKDQVKAQVSKIMPKIEKYVTEYLGAEVLFNIGNDDVTPKREARDDVVCQWNPSSFITPDREWHKTKTVDNRPPQPWITQLAQAAGTQSLFNEFLATPIDFSAFIINRLKIDNLTQEEVFKATNDQLDWHNPEGRPYLHDLSKPLPLILNERGRQVIPFDHFINNDLEYLKEGGSSQRYTTSITKMKAADYGQVNWIEDKVPRIWSLVKVNYDKHAY